MANIETHGWHVINVLEDPGGPPFSYSIGIYETLGQPEIIIVGLPHEVAHPPINDVGEALRGGKRFVPGGVYDDLLEGYDCAFRDVPSRQYWCYLGRAVGHYGGENFPVHQLVYPDRKGRWPWDSEAGDGFREQQPVLADTPEPLWAVGLRQGRQSG